MGNVTRGEDKRKRNEWGPKRIAISVMALLMALLFIVPLVMEIVQYAHAVTQSDIARLTAQQEALLEQQSGLQTELDKLADQENTAVQRCTLLRDQIVVLQDEIANTQDVVKEYEGQIKVSREKLKEAKKEEKNYYDLFCQRVRSMEENSNQSYWQILFEASNFSDLLDRAAFVSGVMAYDDEVLTKLENARKDVARATKTLQKKKAAKEKSLKELERENKQVTKASREAGAALQEIQRNEAAYAQEIQQLDVSAEELAADIINAKAAYAAEQRAAAEQAAAAQAAAAARAAEQAAAREQEEAAAKKAAARQAATKKKAAREDAAAKKAEREAAEAKAAAKKAAAEQAAARKAAAEQASEKQAAKNAAAAKRKAAAAKAAAAKQAAAEAAAKAAAAKQAAAEAAAKKARAAAQKAEAERKAAAKAAAEAAARQKQAKARQPKEVPAAVGGNSRGASVVNYALKHVGGKYVWGGSDLSTGVDCSGFVKCVYAKSGRNLPHSSKALAKTGKGVSYSKARMGDVICYKGHVGIYIGGGKMVDAMGVKYGIVVSRVNKKKVIAVRRIL